MQRPSTLSAFSKNEYARAHTILASKVATMMGRKFEEGDWSQVYCLAKGIPLQSWSNLNIDIMHESLGVEQKMLCVPSNKSIKEHCGTSLMHPSATRSIRVASDGDPTKVARDVLIQYGNLINERRQKVLEKYPQTEPDLRIGWLLWQVSLEEFLYFEEEMLAPNPVDYWAEWRDSGGGARKASRNLWIYENETGKKRYSITTSAGAKIQPYFDVPAPNDPNLYYFRVQGEELEGGVTRLWITSTTAALLEQTLGNFDVETLSVAVTEAAKEVSSILASDGNRVQEVYELAKPIFLTQYAYYALKQGFPGISDEHMIQLFVRYKQQQEPRQ